MEEGGLRLRVESFRFGSQEKQVTTVVPSSTEEPESKGSKATPLTAFKGIKERKREKKRRKINARDGIHLSRVNDEAA